MKKMTLDLVLETLESSEYLHTWVWGKPGYKSNIRLVHEVLVKNWEDYYQDQDFKRPSKKFATECYSTLGKLFRHPSSLTSR